MGSPRKAEKRKLHKHLRARKLRLGRSKVAQGPASSCLRKLIMRHHEGNLREQDYVSLNQEDPE
jgi:hypothetical protein